MVTGCAVPWLGRGRVPLVGIGVLGSVCGGRGWLPLHGNAPSCGPAGHSARGGLGGAAGAVPGGAWPHGGESGWVPTSGAEVPVPGALPGARPWSSGFASVSPERVGGSLRSSHAQRLGPTARRWRVWSLLGCWRRSCGFGLGAGAHPRGWGLRSCVPAAGAVRPRARTLRRTMFVVRFSGVGAGFGSRSRTGASLTPMCSWIRTCPRTSWLLGRCRGMRCTRCATAGGTGPFRRSRPMGLSRVP